MATREYSAEEVKDTIVRFLRAQAEAWREESHTENMKGAASRPKIDTLNWGADRLEAMAGQISKMPKEEEIHEEALLVNDGIEPKQVNHPQTEVEDLGAPQNPEGEDDLRLDDEARVLKDIEDAVHESGEGEVAIDATEEPTPAPKAKRGK
jgi:hypothetical protein